MMKYRIFTYGIFVFMLSMSNAYGVTIINETDKPLVARFLFEAQGCTVGAYPGSWEVNDFGLQANWWANDNKVELYVASLTTSTTVEINIHNSMLWALMVYSTELLDPNAFIVTSLVTVVDGTYVDLNGISPYAVFKITQNNGIYTLEKQLQDSTHSFLDDLPYDSLTDESSDISLLDELTDTTLIEQLSIMDSL